MSTPTRRGRIIAVLAAVLVVAVAIALVASAFGGGDAEPPVADAAKVAPESTLVLFDISTDGGRDVVKQAGDILNRFENYAPQRDKLLARLSGAPEDLQVDRDVKPWLGDEAAIALTDTGTATAGSLIMIRVTDEAKAQAFMRRNPKRTAEGTYHGDRYEEYGRLTVAIKDRWLLIGQSGTVRNGLDAINGRGGRTLADTDLYKRAVDGMPDGRVATLYASAGGLRRVLEPMSGLIGGAAVLFDQPSLQSIALSLEPEDRGARIVAHSSLDPKQRGKVTEAFGPTLAGDVPPDALGYVAVDGISGALGRILQAAAGGANAGGIGPILSQLQKQLAKETDGGLQRNLLDLFDGEAAVVVARANPAPILSLMTKTDDEEATAKTLRDLEAPVAKLLTPKGEQAPTWKTTDLSDGVTAHTLRLPTGAGVSYAVFDGRLVISTSTDGIRKIKDTGDGIDSSDRFKDVLGDRPDKVRSLGFLDFSQLLELGEQTGLNDSRAYLAARDDLQKIKAVGVTTTGDEDETTSEIRLSIP